MCKIRSHLQNSLTFAKFAHTCRWANCMPRLMNCDRHESNIDSVPCKDEIRCNNPTQYIEVGSWWLGCLWECHLDLHRSEFQIKDDQDKLKKANRYLVLIKYSIAVSTQSPVPTGGGGRCQDNRAIKKQSWNWIWAIKAFTRIRPIGICPTVEVPFGGLIFQLMVLVIFTREVKVIRWSVSPQGLPPSCPRSANPVRARQVRVQLSTGTTLNFRYIRIPTQFLCQLRHTWPPVRRSVSEINLKIQ